MAGKLHSLEEAAALLGVTPSALNEMRQRGDVNAMRDGAAWKFKQEEIDRVLSDRSGPNDGSAFDLPLDLDSQQDIMLSDMDVGGQGATPMPGGGSDIELKMGGDSGLDLLSSSGIDAGHDPSSPATPPSGISFSGGGSGIDFLGSDVKLAPGDSGFSAGPGASDVLQGGSGKGGSSKGGDAGKTMLTAELADRTGPESSIKMSMRDSESVFSEGAGSDVSHNIEGSGINLLDARDSGLNLDDLQLASSISGIQKKKPASKLGMQGEEDFLLTPLEEQGEDSTDSGSQVIALEGDFGDDATATLMAGDVPGLGAMLEAAGEPGGMGGPLGGPMGAGAQVVYSAPPEASYGIGTVLALGFSTAVMALVGVMMYDIIRHMWSWDTPYSFNSSLMDMILGMFG